MEDKQRRIALIIGNVAYHPAHFDVLVTPRKDAVDLADAFRQIGFEVFGGQPLLDLTFNAFRTALAEFEEELVDSQASDAIIYYAGHGIEIGGANYLVPVDAGPNVLRNPNLNAIPLDAVMDAVMPSGRLRLVVLDACRSDPLSRRLKESLGKPIGGGLARLEPSNNRLLAYSAKEGTTALDGRPGENCPYVKALLTHLQTPRQRVEDFFGNVRDDVVEATGGKQVPYCSVDRGRDALYLNDNPVTVSYFEGVGYRRGVPHGIAPVTPEIVAKRYRSFKFESEDGRVRRITQINSAGQPSADDDGHAIWQFTYREDGQTLDAVQKLDRLGNVKLVERYSDNATIVDFAHGQADGGGPAMAAAQKAFAGGMGFSAANLKSLENSRSQIVRHANRYDANGHLVETRYVIPPWNTPTADAHGNFG